MRTPARSQAARAGRDHRDAGHDPPLAPRANGTQRGVSRPPHERAGTPPGRQRPMTWRTFVQAPAGTRGGRLLHHRGLAARGLVTYYTAFGLELQSRRIQVIGCTPYPSEADVIQSLRQITSETGLLREARI